MSGVWNSHNPLDNTLFTVHFVRQNASYLCKADIYNSEFAFEKRNFLKIGNKKETGLFFNP